MRPTFPILLAVLSGCSMFTPQWEGVWFLDVPVVEQDECEPVVDENYDDAEPPEGPDIESPWTVVDETTLSNSAFFIQVIGGKGNQVFAVFGGEVYPGTADKNLLSVSWTNSTDDLFSQEHEEGYEFSLEQNSETVTTLTLVKGEKGLANGTLTLDTVSSIAYAESDRWRPADVGLDYSQVPSSAWLVGDGVVNLPGQPNCAGNNCELSIDTSCQAEITFAATFAGKYENGMFSSLEDVSQAPGDGGIFLPPPSTYYGY